ncbi:heme exporter protein CcmD [Suttonella ornithocola]|uniref:Heme exporter protein D n=1 Tax=Suttonella ornithocola TaxID=279832 RepID=A0A380MY96_9GAMM|nr:heme exporter protein CcmD [Suttonella ornithocola]SUO96417.1 heme exporter protein CcmD [Suttonella ornithocola]
MAFDSLADFLQMGTHGPYVWAAYGIFLTALIGIHIWIARRYRRLLNTLNTLKD